MRSNINKSKDKLATFIKENFDSNIYKFQKFIIENKLALSDIARKVGLSEGWTIRKMRQYSLIPFTTLSEARREYICEYCGAKFTNYKHREKDDKNIYCSTKCRILANKKTFSYEKFRFDIESYEFTKPSPKLGDYSDVPKGRRRSQFVNKYKVNHFFFKNGIINEETAYIAGIILTDGNLGKSGTNFYVRLGLVDKQIVKDIASEMESKYPIREEDRSKRNRKNIFVITFYSPYLYHDLTCLGCGERKTYYANYPYIKNNELHRHFIRGVIDGDGCWYFHNGSLVLSICGNDMHLYGIAKTIERFLGITPTSLYYPGKKMKSFCKIDYSPVDSVKIRDWIYQDAKIYLKRKYNTAYSIKATFRTSDVAKACNVSMPYVRKLIRTGEIDAFRKGKVFEFDEDGYKEAISYILKRKKQHPSHFPTRYWVKKYDIE
ncbi:hypothetical protein DEFDS_0710 [Deferribacter desulfuricans SSM1]|uniref:DOD-type homing endonuclease domain-containing protein n=1 Tax=Deferribacter desulfuricans (strain DSM 14783 / JCM 11476 / NBRC 101012 / SSM1) TaxID=639282 RepID=D3PC67_DEFDS|nr:helix-turn-helix domain-containing protein [Deferribacter desulfuricans]BAI80190.1 hypothetical protein DEFDS_0710 [Deferribacter desulfuricans SSM1]